MKSWAFTILLMVGGIFPALCFASHEGDLESVKSCLEHWGKNPFGANPTYKTLAVKVKVLGIGSDVRDETVTETPELVLIKPNVNVLSKTEFFLMNPKGWYCLKGKVAVLGKTVINLECQAHLASSSEGVTIAGGSDADDGVTVLGASRINRLGCPSK